MMAWWRTPQSPGKEVAISEAASAVNWQNPVRELPDGPVDLWLVIISTEGRILGGAPLPDKGRMTWWWLNGQLAGKALGVTIDIWEAGHIGNILIVAVAGGRYAVVKNSGFTWDRGNLRKGDVATFPSVDFTFPE